MGTLFGLLLAYCLIWGRGQLLEMKPRVPCILKTCSAPQLFSQPQESVGLNSCFMSPIIQRTHFSRKLLIVYLSVKTQGWVSCVLSGDPILTLSHTRKEFSPCGCGPRAHTGSRVRTKLQKWTVTHPRVVGNTVDVGA